MTMSRWQPFWIFAGEESYDPNSGLSFSITMYVIGESGQLFSVEVHLYKPQIYGLWHCLWNNKKHIQQLTSQNVSGIVVIDKSLMTFGLIAMKDYYPFPHFFPVQPHCIDNATEHNILLHIDQSVVPLDKENLFYHTFLHNHVNHVDSLFDELEDIVPLDSTQKTLLVERWSRAIIKDVIQNQDEEYGIDNGSLKTKT